MDIAMLNLQAGWIGFIGGAVTGSMLGLFFHGNDWLGGYASFRRRMFRLGHISFFGLGFINKWGLHLAVPSTTCSKLLPAHNCLVGFWGRGHNLLK